MKFLIAVAAIVALSATAASAQYYGSGSRNSGSGSSYQYGFGSNSSSTYVQPHVNNNGSFTSGHFRTTPNNTQMDNYGTRGNYNPYTGNYGTRTPRY